MRFPVIFGLLIAMLNQHAYTAAAQNFVSARPAACVTNFPDGQIPAGYFGVVTPPVTFASAQASSSSFDIFDDIQLDRSTLVFAYPNSATANGPITIMFKDEDANMVHQCALRVVNDVPAGAFDQSVVGSCDFGTGRDQIRLTEGQTALLETLAPLSEVSTAPTSVVSGAPMSRTSIQVAGVQEGRAHLLWLGSDNGNGMLGGLCPVEVGPAN